MYLIMMTYTASKASIARAVILTDWCMSVQIARYVDFTSDRCLSMNDVWQWNSTRLSAREAEASPADLPDTEPIDSEGRIHGRPRRRSTTHSSVEIYYM